MLLLSLVRTFPFPVSFFFRLLPFVVTLAFPCDGDVLLTVSFLFLFSEANMGMMLDCLHIIAKSKYNNNDSNNSKK